MGSKKKIPRGGEAKREGKKEKKPAPEQPEFSVQDDFAKHNPELWEMVGKGWEFKDGAVHQTQHITDALRRYVIAEGNDLVEQALGVAQGAVSAVRQQVEGLLVGADALFGGDLF